MRETLTAYFAAERAQGFFWLGTGVVAIGIGLWLVLGRGDYRGTGWPLIVLGLVEGLVGVTGIFNDGRVAGLIARLDQDVGALVAAEAERMRGLATAFTIMKCVEIGIFLSGGLLVLLSAARSTWYAVGVGLVVQGGAALTLEAIAHRRNSDYGAAIEAHAASLGGGATELTPPRAGPP